LCGSYGFTIPLIGFCGNRRKIRNGRRIDDALETHRLDEGDDLADAVDALCWLPDYLDYAVGALGGQVGEDLDAGAGFLQKKGKMPEVSAKTTVNGRK
jgi:hypothetical protein